MPYFPLTQDVLQKIIEINLNKIKTRLKDRYKAKVTFSTDTMKYLLDKCTDPDTGARNAENVINKSILPAVSNACLQALVDGKEISELSVKLVGGEFEVTVV